MKKHLLDSLVIGFALFSMFFGAGNVIFPPYLGLESGPEWLLGFLSYFLADIGLAMLAMFAILRQGSPDGITARIGKLPSTVLMCAIVLCIGPMLAIPRTAATTYETSLAPLVAGFSPVLFSILFFLLILLLCVRETAVVDIVGKILTPALLIGLLVLIVIGGGEPHRPGGPAAPGGERGRHRRGGRLPDHGRAGRHRVRLYHPEERPGEGPHGVPGPDPGDLRRQPGGGGRGSWWCTWG